MALANSMILVDQIGGAAGRPALIAVLLEDYWHLLYGKLGRLGIHVTGSEVDQGKESLTSRTSWATSSTPTPRRTS